MTKFAIIVAAGVLAACSGAPAGQAADDQGERVEAEAESAESVAGRYEVVRADGSGFISVINADGTYAEVVDGVAAVTGRWQAEGERTCYEPDGAAPRTCYSFGPPPEGAADGSFAAISERGDVLTVRPLSE